MVKPEDISKEAWDIAEAVLMESPLTMVPTKEWAETQALIARALASQALRSQGEAGRKFPEPLFAFRDVVENGDGTANLVPVTHPAPQEAGDVKVKPLEWDENGDYAVAESITGRYRVLHDANEPNEWTVRDRWGNEIGREPSMEAGMETAQAIHDGLVRSALTEGSSR